MDQGRDVERADKRQGRRARVLIGAKLIIGGRALDVRLRDLSQNGALLLCDRPPPLHSEVTFERGELRAAARVVWSRGDRFGIAFDEPIDAQEALIHGEPVKRYEPPAHCEPPPMREREDIYSHHLTPEERATAETWFHSDGRKFD
jgi:hypothetical protein